MIHVRGHVARDEPVALLSPRASPGDPGWEGALPHGRGRARPLVLPHKARTTPSSLADVEAACLVLVRVGARVRHPRMARRRRHFFIVFVKNIFLFLRTLRHMR